MTSIVQDIQFVRSLRKDLTVGGDLKLPPNILNSIEAIHNCIKSGTDLNGWKKIDWRNGGGGTRSLGPIQQRSGSNSGQGYNRGGNGSSGFFGGRQSNCSTEQSSQYAFGGRAKGHRISEPQSIPLTGTVASDHSTSSPDATSGSLPVSVPHISADGFRTAPQ